MQRHAGSCQQLAAVTELEYVVRVTTIRQTAPARNEALRSQPTEVVGDEVLRQPDERAQLSDPAIAVCKFAEYAPANGVASEPQKRRRRGVTLRYRA
jgi:hypothetical protein